MSTSPLKDTSKGYGAEDVSLKHEVAIAGIRHIFTDTALKARMRYEDFAWHTDSSWHNFQTTLVRVKTQETKGAVHTKGVKTEARDLSRLSRFC